MYKYNTFDQTGYHRQQTKDIFFYWLQSKFSLFI